MRFCPQKNTPDKDRVMTPLWLAVEIVQHFAPSGLVLDPCRGEGAFYDSFPLSPRWKQTSAKCGRWNKHQSMRCYCEIDDGFDFFRWSTSVDWIITNPPWSKIREFLTHGMRYSDNVVYLSTVNHFTTRRRINDILKANFGVREIYLVPTPGKPWPQLGFALGAVHLQRDYKGDTKISKSPNWITELSDRHE